MGDCPPLGVLRLVDLFPLYMPLLLIREALDLPSRIYTFHVEEGLQVQEAPQTPQAHYPLA